jgi:general secretion pathway protein K
LKTWSAYQEVLFALTTALTTPELIEPPARKKDPRDKFTLSLQESRVFLNLYGEPVSWEEDVTVSLQDTNGMVSLISEDPGPLRKLLEYNRLESATVNTIIDSLADWQDDDDFKHLNGAEKWQYKEANAPYEPRNFYCQYLDEMLLVQGMSPEIYDRLKPALTYLGTGGVNYMNASANTLRALLHPQADIAERLIEFRQKGLLTQGLFQDISGIGGSDELGLISASRIEITLEGKHGHAHSRIKMIYNKRETQKAPFQVELWQK